MTVEHNNRILIIDDNKDIHRDFKKILCAEKSSDPAASKLVDKFLDEADTDTASPSVSFEVDSAYQGQEGLQMVARAEESGKPYAVAFIDMRMPPGWNGLETIAEIWKRYPNLQVVNCTAYSDHSWAEIVRELGETDQLMILKKPFDPVEVQQFACALTKRWKLAREAEFKMSELSEMSDERASALVEMRSQELREFLDDVVTDEPAGSADSSDSFRFAAGN